MLKRLSISIESWVLSELFTEDGVALEQLVKEDIVSHTKHHAVSDCHLIASDESRVVVFQLFLAVNQEWSPLRCNQFLELRVS